MDFSQIIHPTSSEGNVEQIYFLLIFLTAFLVILMIGTTWINKRSGKNARLKSIPGGYNVPVHKAEFRKQIKDLLSQHGLADQVGTVSLGIKQKVARLNVALLELPPKEVVETFFLGQLEETKKILIANALDKPNSAAYFWAISDICYIQLDFNTALFYIDQALRAPGANEAMRESKMYLVDLWESRVQTSPITIAETDPKP